MERDTTVYKQAIQKEHKFESFQGVWNIPGEERRSGVILYLCREEKRMKHGIVLAERTGVRVFCCAGCQENSEHALEAYQYLLKKGYVSGHVIWCVEHADDSLECYLYEKKDDGVRALDATAVNRFLNRVMPRRSGHRWLKLDNAAKIYPASRTNTWSNVYRLSVTLKEPVEIAILQTALHVTIRRFPSIAVRLQRGVFWYYLEQLSSAPEIRAENSYPLTRMSKRETEKCAFRVLVYDKRIAVEIFHSLTDGNGALVFLKSLLAEYLQEKYGVYIPAECGVLGRLEEPSEEEIEDSFQKYAGKLCAGRRENTAWKLKGTPELGGFLNVTCLKLPADEMLKKAHEYGVSLTTFLGASIMMAMQNSQKDKVQHQNRRKPIKLMIPVDLRRLFPSKTLRNFALYTTPEILPRLGEYSFEEICQIIQCKLKTDNTPKQMSMMIAANVSSERMMAVRVMPLFLKNLVMKAVFKSVGERKSCLSMSNLGVVELPEAMLPYVQRFDFVLGVQESAPYNCGVLTFGDTMYVNFIRDIQEADLEYYFHCVLREMGIVAEVESNQASK